MLPATPRETHFRCRLLVLSTVMEVLLFTGEAMLKLSHWELSLETLIPHHSLAKAYQDLLQGLKNDFLLYMEVFAVLSTS